VIAYVEIIMTGMKPKNQYPQIDGILNRTIENNGANTPQSIQTAGENYSDQTGRHINLHLHFT
jgi:hypothetical protein